MKLYLITQQERTGYDTDSGVVVVAQDEQAARQMHPNADTPEQNEEAWQEEWRDCWASTPEHVQVRLLGQAEAGAEPGIVLVSFHAG